MDERSFAGTGETHLPPEPGFEPAPAGAMPGSGPRTFLDDPRALQILSTEHWSLLSARSLVYNEAFSRAGMFLSFLSATLVALGLVATATGFSDGLLMIAAVILAIDLFVGLATIGRIASASGEDIRYLQAMNRIRHAYSEITPGVEAYFVTGRYDDRTALGMYGPARPSRLQVVLHGFTTTPGMLSVICSAVAGALGAVLTMLATHQPAAAGIAGLVVTGGVLALNVSIAARSFVGFMRSMKVLFPSPDQPDR